MVRLGQRKASTPPRPRSDSAGISITCKFDEFQAVAARCLARASAHGAVRVLAPSVPTRRESQSGVGPAAPSHRRLFPRLPLTTPPALAKRCKHVPKESAADVVFGYCAGNDVSVRDWQMQTTQWVLGKSFDTHAPIGPWIVTADEIGDPHTMGIRCFVNGERRQNSNTENLVFNVYDQIAHLSRAMTLEPGDIIFTGTPGGVGLAMQPPQWLKAGDKVRVEIDRIGSIEAEMQPERASQAASSWR